MAIQIKTGIISRAKLQALTNDHETTKYLENLQRDVAGPVTDGIDDAQAVAEQAQTVAATAKTAAEAAQIAASQAITDAAAAQTTANSASSAAAAAQSSANAAQSDATYARNLADHVNNDYISKSFNSPQGVANTFRATAFVVGVDQVVGARQTGWTSGTGTPNKGAFAADTAYAASAAYTQAEAAAAYSSLQQARQRILALETALRAHGLIN